jgi:hypothetical protein
MNKLHFIGSLSALTPAASNILLKNSNLWLLSFSIFVFSIYAHMYICTYTCLSIGLFCVFAEQL